MDGRKTRNDRTVSLVSEVRRRILEDIITGEMPPNSIIQLTNLAERYQVSRTPIREALTVLEEQGLVSAIAYKGYLVSGIVPSDVNDVFFMRRLLEGTSAELATKRITDEEIDTLEKLRPPEVGRMTLDYDEYAHDFHVTLAQAAGSPRLLSAFESTYNDVRRLQYAGIGSPRPDLIHAEHQLIVEALRNRDSAEAKRLMEQHLDLVRARALEGWVGHS